MLVDLNKTKTKFCLIGFGALFGIAFGVILGYSIKYLVYGSQSAPIEGASFDNLSDLRRAMLSRDSRDLHSDGSVSFRSIVVPDESDRIIYRLAPNLEVKFHNVPVKTNSYGLRSAEIPLEKPPGVYRIALLGDSFAFGWGVDQSLIFAERLEVGLNEKIQHQGKVEVLNFGVPGYSTFQEVALFEDLGVKFNPDAVVVFFITNDFGLPFFIKNFSSPGKLVDNRKFSAFKKETVNEEIKTKSKELNENLDPNKALAVLADLCKQKGIKLFMVINPGKQAESDRKKLWILNERQDIIELSLREDFLRIVAERNIPHKSLSLVGDPHPSSIKHGILGELLTDRILPYIQLH